MTTKNLIRFLRIAVAAFAALVPIALAAATPGVGERAPYSMRILVDARPLREYAARGKTYIEAIRGAEYSIRLSNHTGRRVAVALSVDGLNSIDAKTTTARAASKWILGPFETITIDGWQTSSSTARRFFFTTEEDSYGAWLGKTENLGVISAAFFEERRKEPAPYTRFERERGKQSGDAGRRDARSREEKRRAAEPSAAEAPSELSDDLAATGIGRELDHRVRHLSFDAEIRPATVLNVRYEYRDPLVRLGVLPSPERPLSRREGSRGFEDTGFAPDPFRDR